MRYTVTCDVTFSKEFIVEAESELEAWEKTNAMLEETTRSDINDDVGGWDISDKGVAGIDAAPGGEDAT